MIQVIIKPTTKCNLNCLYCNVEERLNINISTDEVKKFFSTLVERFPTERISVKWHGGEPLLMGLDFFNSAIECQKRLSSDFENEISTNLTLLNGQYLKLFKENNFIIYTSMDGIGPRHDFQRDGSFDKVRQALINLKDTGISNVFVTSTVTEHNLCSIEEIYDLCLSLSYKWKFSVVIPSGIQKVQAENLIVNPTNFSTTIIKIFNRWFMSETPLEVPVFQNVIKYIIKRDDYLDDSKPPLTLAPDGNLYLCPLLVGNSKYAVGKFDSQDSIKKLGCLTCSWQRIAFEKCKSCYFEFFCKITHCGYIHEVKNRFDSLPNYLCSCWEPIYFHILDRVTQEISINN